MAFDAGMVAAVAHELRQKLIDAKVEKIHQPERDEIDIYFHRGRDTHRLLISAGANNPRIHISGTSKENPLVPPMFCTLLRKHLGGGKLVEVTQLGFERALDLTFEAYDELGFVCRRHLICEIMGKYSNIIFCDDTMKVINSIKLVDFTTSAKRQILPGMRYELPPAQEKRDPTSETKENFAEIIASSDYDTPADKFILSKYSGISSLSAREIVHSASGRSDTAIGECDKTRLVLALTKFFENIKNNIFTPTLVKNKDGAPLEYSFCDIRQYGNDAVTVTFDDISALIDEFFTSRDRTDRIKQRAADIMRLLTNAENRLTKKIAIQEADLAECADKDKFKRKGDLITSNMHLLERGMKSVTLIDYYDENMPEMTLELDTRLSPSQNAQRFYKRYNKAKTAEVELARQIKLAREELDYIYTVFDSLTKAENQTDLDEIRAELHSSGYASRMKNYTVQKLRKTKPAEFVTDGGYRLLCGKNNSQNDFVTTHAAEKLDYWFHVKNMPGSHVIMRCAGLPEPSELDFTQAAMVAAYYSKAGKGSSVAVDYTLAKNVKKPSGSKPGFVIYNTNWTAYVTPDEDTVRRMRERAE